MSVSLASRAAICSLVLCFSTFFATHPESVSAASVSSLPQVAAGGVYNEEPGETEPAVYIIQLADEPLATYGGDIPGLAATSPRVTGSRKLDVNGAASRAYESYLAERQAEFEESYVAAAREVGELLLAHPQHQATLPKSPSDPEVHRMGPIVRGHPFLALGHAAPILRTRRCGSLLPLSYLIF
jgi:hypothetical protein